VARRARRRRTILRLRRQRDYLEQHLTEQRRIAAALQEHFLHPLPEIAGWEFGLATLTAGAVELIGGDFHDVFAISDRQLAVLLGDVEGKGVTAAGLTETVHIATRALALFTPSPGFVLERVNKLLLLQESDLVTALFAVVSRQSGMMSIGSAGHPPPLHLHRDGSLSRLTIAPGPPLGAFETSGYAMSVAQLEPGDALLLYTDGVTDARRDGRFLGEDGLLEAARPLTGHSAQEIASGLRRSVSEFADTLRDDVHILVVKRVAGTAW